MDFDLFVYGTIGRRHELEEGRAGLKGELYQRMLGELGALVRFADEHGYAGFGHPEHHLQIEGFEIANDPGLLSMWLGQHRERLRIITCGFVSTTHNPLRVAENIATLDHMHHGRFGVGLVRGYQARWVENFKTRPDVGAVGFWNRGGPDDEANRGYFEEFVEVVVTALTNDTFSYEGEYWKFPAVDRNPHEHSVYTEFGSGVDDDMAIREVGIAPRPFQRPHPPLYSGFTGSATTAAFWGRYGGKSIVLGGPPELHRAIWDAYDDTARRFGREVVPGEQACWGGLMICAETDADARRQLDDMEWFWNRWSLPFGLPMPKLLVGSPDTIAAEIEEAASNVPINECMLLVPQGIHSPAQLEASLGLFASEVMPQFA
ncbi:MAG: LLM class flavin-dependent oxidoreductase [Acidimicrobiia bacterium]|nr:LLM class flavin-dependent oxidoreductase [Acidimicrobiia bacterium]